MSVAAHKLGEFIERCDERNTDLQLGLESVMGMNLSKEVIPTKANLSGNDLSNFKVVHPGDFIYNPRTHGKRIGLAYNNGTNDFLISWNNAAFRLKDASTLMPLYLYMYFLRDEWDREACYQSWGSSTEVFSWDALCEMKLPIPPIEEQRKAVEVWQGLRKMKEENEQLAEPLMQLCRSYLEECKKKWPMTELGPMIHLVDETNLSRRELQVVGVNFQKEFMPTAANMDGIDTAKYKVMTKDRFVFSGMQTGRDVCIRIGLWTDENDALVSPAYSTFEVGGPRSVAAADEQSDATERVPPLLPEYLFLWFKRGEIDRLGWFYSDSSVRANLDWNRFCAIKIPLPPMEVQQAIVDVYRCASEAKKIAAEAEELSRAVCPALVRGAEKGNRPDGAGRRNTGNRPDGSGQRKTGNRPDGTGRSKTGPDGVEQSNTPEEG